MKNYSKGKKHPNQGRMTDNYDMSGKGSNNCYKEKATRGQVMRTETGVDHSSHMVDNHEALMGRRMGGGVDNVSHSLSSAGTVNTYNNAGPKGKQR